MRMHAGSVDLLVAICDLMPWPQFRQIHLWDSITSMDVKG